MENDYEALVDYDEDLNTENENKSYKEKETTKGYVAGNSSSFSDFLFKPEIHRSIVECGFEHPSEVQYRCIPKAVLGIDILCQAKSGMGKTAVFVLSVLQQLVVQPNTVSCLVLCHTRELAFQISNEFSRFSKHCPDVNVAVFYGGIELKLNESILKGDVPNIVVGTPGRILHLCQKKLLDLSKVQHFILDECDKVLQDIKMRDVVQRIFKQTPINKQVMMFSATLNQEIKEVSKKFMNQPMEIYVDSESKLNLHGLQQYYVLLTETEKNQKLQNLLDTLSMNQLVIFVRTAKRASILNELISGNGYPSICIHSDMDQKTRIYNYKLFKDFEKRILVATDLFQRGIDIQKVNIVINYDMPDSADSYLHRVGRAGRFGTKGLAVSFVNKESTKDKYTNKTEEEVLQEIQDRFKVKIKDLPSQIDPSSYKS